MKRIRFKGIVRLAQTVRRELTGPILPGRLAKLQKWVQDALHSIDQLLAFHKLDSRAMFPPSRKAYEFLRRVDFSKARVATPAAAPAPPVSPEPPATAVKTLHFRGLKAYLLRLLTDLSNAETPERMDELYSLLRQTSENLERHIQSRDLRPDHMTANTRAIRGWFAYFSRREHFDTYISALRLAKPIFDAALRRSRRFRPPVELRFWPQRNLYAAQGNTAGTHLSLPTALIAFTADQFTQLADTIVRRGQSNEEILKTFFGERCRAIQSAVEELGGRVDRSAGRTYHLGRSFDRVNADYFDNAMPRPHLIWSRSHTQRVFGHYNFAHDTVMVSRSLDHPEVPEFVVDYIMYHELLHKKLGIRWQDGQKRVHPPEFRREMKKFKDHREAEAVIKRLAER